MNNRKNNSSPALELEHYGMDALADGAISLLKRLDRDLRIDQDLVIRLKYPCAIRSVAQC